jgi:hypothetical protein
MNNDKGAHDSHDLPTGESVHLVRHPRGKWQVSSYDWSSTDGLMLLTVQVFAQTLGWENLDFDSADDAYTFVEQQLRDGKAPSKASH